MARGGCQNPSARGKQIVMRGTLRRKSTDSWQLRIFRGRDDNGRQICDYHTIYATTKREAEAARTSILHALDTGGYAQPSRLTVAEYLESWLADYASSNVSPATFDRYESIVRKHLIPAFGTIRLNQLTPATIERSNIRALQGGRIDGKGGLSPQTVIKHHRVLRSALKRAVRLGLIATNPCDRVDPPRSTRLEMTALDEYDTERLLGMARTMEPLSLFAAVLLASNAGLRRGEALALRWADIDFEAGVLHVRRALQRSREGLSFGEPKTNASRRRLSLDHETLAQLTAYRARQTARSLELGEAWRDDDLICAARLGGPWHPNDLSREFRRLRERLGLSLRFHDLRHSHASQLIRTGAPAKVVQERLGHASAGFTLTVYGHLLPGMQDDAVARLAEARESARARMTRDG